MPTFKEAAFYVENGVTYYFKDTKAREQLKECYSPSNPPPAPSGVLPPGGTTDQVLKKASNDDFDVEWGAGGGGGGPTNTWYATCGTSSGVGAKTATSATGDFVLATGAMVRVLFSNSNTAANPTISIDGSTAKNIRPVSGASGMDYMWKAGEVIDIVYDGSNFVMTKGGKADTSFYGITKLDSSTNSTATNVAATPKAVKDVKDMIPTASSATPQDLGTAAAGSSADYSRADHVHNKPTYTKGDVGLGNVDNVQQYSASNPPPYPVTSVNGQTGAVSVGTIAVQDSAPVGDELVWIDTDEPGANVTIPQIDDDNVSEDDTWSSQKIASREYFQKGDTFSLTGEYAYCVARAISTSAIQIAFWLPKPLASDVTTVTFNGDVAWARNAAKNLGSSNFTYASSAVLTRTQIVFAFNCSYAITGNEIFVAAVGNGTITFG